MLALVVAAFAAFCPSAAAQNLVYSRAHGRLLSEWDVAVLVKRAGVVLAGESHDRRDHHEMQAHLLELMAQGDGPVALALEMLNVMDQPVIDQFMSGELPEGGFELYWNKHWGADSYQIYRPIFVAAKRAGVFVVAVNAPMGLVGRAARNGLDSLSPAERALLAGEVGPIINKEYEQKIRNDLERAGHGKMAEQYLMGMRIWNETMGENVLKQRALGRRALVICGSDHTVFRSGIAESIARRSSEPALVVLPFPLDDSVQNKDQLVAQLKDSSLEFGRWADLYWLLPLANNFD